MSNKSRDYLTIPLAIMTLVATGLAGWLLWGARLFRAGGAFPELDKLEQIGAFLSGVFTPLALAWAARSFLLQKQGIDKTLSAMQEQLQVQRNANDQTGTAVKEQLQLLRQSNQHMQDQLALQRESEEIKRLAMEDQLQLQKEQNDRLREEFADDRVRREQERARSGPTFSLALSTQGLSGSKLFLHNLGAVSKRTRVSWQVTNKTDITKVYCAKTLPLNHPFQSNDKVTIEITIGSGAPSESELQTEVKIQAERADGEFGLWIFSFDGYSNPSQAVEYPIYPDAKF